MEKPAELLKTFNSCQCEELEFGGALIKEQLQATCQFSPTELAPSAQPRYQGQGQNRRTESLLKHLRPFPQSNSPPKAGSRKELTESPLRCTEPLPNAKQDEGRASKTGKAQGRVQEQDELQTYPDS